MTVLLKRENPGNFEFALELLRSGRPVALPTETVYGLAAPIFDERALSRVFEIKNRPQFDPLIVHVLDKAAVEDLIKGEVTPLQARLMQKFWPGPLTILFEKNEKVPDLCTAGSPWVAVRSPRHPIFREVLSKLERPYLAAPSANRFTSVSPTSSADVLRELSSFGLEAVFEGGPCDLGLESTVIKIEKLPSGAEKVLVLRPGSLTIETLRLELGEDIEITINPSGSGAQKGSPGTHQVHYSPGVPLQFFESVAEFSAALPQLKISELLLLEMVRGQLAEFSRHPWKEKMTVGRDLPEAAKNIFKTLRQLGDLRPKGVVAVGLPSEGLGLALNDRLRRAAGRG